MATTFAVPDGRVAMAATTYTGTGATLAVSNAVNTVSFQPDFVWMKGRSGATDHALYDSVRGATFDLVSNSTAAETTQTTGLTTFGTAGFTVGALAKVNTSAATYVGWQWKAGGTAVSNTAGTITSSVSANTTAGFSVVTYTGNLSAVGTATVGHGLGAAPAMIMVKTRNGPADWVVNHISLTTWSNILFLNNTSAQYNIVGNGTIIAPTNAVFTTNYTTGMNISGFTQVAYCWAPVAGYSAFGGYTGNGSADGPFIYTGFRPRWLMIKSSTVAGSYWYVTDSSVNAYNEAKTVLSPNDSAAEDTQTYGIDFVSNGFKIRSPAGYGNNGSGSTYIYAAYAENPLKYANAR